MRCSGRMGGGAGGGGLRVRQCQWSTFTPLIESERSSRRGSAATSPGTRPALMVSLLWDARFVLGGRLI